MEPARVGLRVLRDGHRVCRSCDRQLPLELFKRGNGPDGYLFTCLDCYRGAHIEGLAKPRESKVPESPFVPIVRHKDRGVTVQLGRRSNADVDVEALLYPEQVERPKTRADCEHGVRPCPFVGCKFNLYLDDGTGEESLKFNYPADVEPWDMPEHMSCVLDLAEREGMTLDEVGKCLGITKERVRQVEGTTHRRINARLPRELRGVVELFERKEFDSP